MIHQYQLGGYNIVLDVCSGSVHVVDAPAYDMIAIYKDHPKDEVIRRITEADREVYYRNIPADPDALDHMHRIWEEAGDPRKYPTAP